MNFIKDNSSFDSEIELRGTCTCTYECYIADLDGDGTAEVAGKNANPSS